MLRDLLVRLPSFLLARLALASLLRLPISIATGSCCDVHPWSPRRVAYDGPSGGAKSWSCAVVRSFHWPESSKLAFPTAISISAILLFGCTHDAEGQSLRCAEHAPRGEERGTPESHSTARRASPVPVRDLDLLNSLSRTTTRYCTCIARFRYFVL